MHSFSPKKSVAVISIGLCLCICYTSLAEPVNVEQVRKTSDTFLNLQHIRQRKQIRLFSVKGEQEPPVREFTAAGLREICGDDGIVLAYIIELEPRGFISTSADTDITPIIAYSFRSSFPPDGSRNNPLYRLLKEDMKLRAKALAEYGQLKTMENDNLWNLYVNEDIRKLASQTFQQWPQENTTSTGGWLETAWDQDSPYNDFCPLDPVDANRSYVGCGPTAMAQVTNYHQQCSVHFDENDSYTTYTGIDIDDDSGLYDFPSFNALNDYLGVLRLKYSRQMKPDDTDAAALCFACGIAAETYYSSEGSGTSVYDVQQAFLKKFGFYSADMTGGLSYESYPLLQENMINRLPALLSFCPPDGFGGHVIVCDGYNTDGAYHLNFGWGSPYPEEITEVWYHLPNGIILMEAILNIQPISPTIDADPSSLLFYSVPGQESEPKMLFIKNNTSQRILINSIYSPEGFVISASDDGYSDHIDSLEIQRPGQEAAINVKFCPADAGGYYGTLTIHYGDGNRKYVILKGCSFTGGTEIPQGEVSGRWSQARSPYFVSGDIKVPENRQLLIEPGVKIIFVGPYGMTIGKNALLIAEGNKYHPIEFTAWNRNLGWTGLRFLDSGADDILSYCSITFSKKFLQPTAEDDYSAEDNDEDSCGGGVYCYRSDPTITNCKIINNIGDKGGAIYCGDSDPVIRNTVIANNSSMGGRTRSGGICCEGDSTAQIKNCTIVNNTPGGIFIASDYTIDVTNTIVWGNSAYQIYTSKSTPVISFCDVQDGYPGQANFDADPCFFEPSAAAGVDYDGTVAHWALQSCSPCINAGTQTNLPADDLAGNPRVYSGIVDVGAYENQSELPLITVAPSVDAGFVPIGTDSTISLEIRNTGMIDFEVKSLGISERSRAFSIVTPIYNHQLLPDDFVRAQIRFAPIEEKVYTATIYINSTSSNAPHKQVTLRGVGVSGTIIPGGTVSGTWTKADSPYTVIGDINIPRGQTLTIQPGVEVKFAGHFGLTVGYKATLRARGWDTDPIIFTPIDTNEGWFGIRFVDSEADDILKYCTIEYSKKPETGGGGDANLTGGGILCYSTWIEQIGYRAPSSPMIDHCLIANNYAESGGGIMCMDDSEAVITNNTIVDNSARIDGAGISIFDASPMIKNNVIAHNSGLLGGGIMNWFGLPSIINNTIVHNRPNAIELGPTTLFEWAWQAQPVLNNIIWQNEMHIYEIEYFSPEQYDIRFNNIQGGWEGEGNIDVDPCFKDPQKRDYHLKSQAGRWDPQSESWVKDDVTSPCIDAGDPATPIGLEPVPNGGIINMGAYGGTAEASKSPGN